MTDDVLSVRYSPDGRLLAVALLDSTVKVFYQDSLKFFLSLYGHKVRICYQLCSAVDSGRTHPSQYLFRLLQLPVLSMDISSDSKLLVTCSADKNIKIWGLDFGDCHKSIFAHDESVMQVAFERDSHYFWSGGKDKYIKYWDGDKVRRSTNASER
jgi:U3 small nucleolar RNA-associated protein 12